MVSSLTAEPVASTSTGTTLKATSPEFRLLGLRPREARLEVIRRALKETAGDVKAAEHWAGEEPVSSRHLRHEDGRLAQVAVAGYRLLDPRRRRTLFERVQLLLWTEDDVDSPTASLWEAAKTDGASTEGVAAATLAAAANAAKATAAQATSSSARVPFASTVTPSEETKPSEETRVALEVFRTLRSRDRRATALWVSVAALAISLPGAVALFVALL